MITWAWCLTSARAHATFSPASQGRRNPWDPSQLASFAFTDFRICIHLISLLHPSSLLGASCIAPRSENLSGQVDDAEPPSPGSQYWPSPCWARSLAAVQSAAGEERDLGSPPHSTIWVGDRYNDPPSSWAWQLIPLQLPCLLEVLKQF